MQTSQSQPPEFLSDTAAAWWSEVATEFDFAAHDLEILTAAAGCIDRIRQSREEIDREGAFIQDRYGKPKAHPALNAENQAKLTMARLIRELALPIEDVNDTRPPTRR